MSNCSSFSAVSVRALASLCLLCSVASASADLVNETILNNSAITATPLDDGDCGVGDIDPTGDEDFWSRNDAVEGDILFSYIHTAESTNSDNSFLEIIAADGSTVLANNDNDGPGGGSVVAGLLLEADGPIYYRVTETGDNDQITPYELSQILANPLDTLGEIEPNNSAGSATPIEATITTGEAAASDADLDFYAIELTAGDSLVVIVDEDPEADGDASDTRLDLIDPDHSTVLESGDNMAGNFGNALRYSMAPNSGTYYIRISNNTGADTTYRFVTLVDCARSCDDTDGDGICDAADNCPETVNPAQADDDSDGAGDVCDLCTGDDASGDTDEDGFCDDTDNCPEAANGSQADDDEDGFGDECDLCVGDDTSGDTDEDGVCDDGDLCVGDDATGDTDEDGTCDEIDECPEDANKTEAGACGCGVADTDTDGDGTADCIDECPESPDKTEAGTCGCDVDDADADLDGIVNCEDNCPTTANFPQADADDDGIGDQCDPTPFGDLCGSLGQFFIPMSLTMMPLLVVSMRRRGKRSGRSRNR